MKYISLIVFAIALTWTWMVIHDNNAVSFETHSGIQEQLAVFISDTVKAKRTSATDIVIEKIWTEALGEKKVKAHFIYTFKDNQGEGLVATQITGEGILERQPEDGSGNDRWTLTQIQTNSDSIVFEDALLVTPGEEPQEAAPAQPTTPEPESKTSP